MNDNYALDLLGTLDQSKSKKQINSDIKQLEKAINALRLTATFAKADTKKELNAYITQLSNQLSTIKLKAKIDNKTLKNEINKALNNVSFKDIDTLSIDENKAKLKVQKVIADTKSYVEKNPISVSVNIDSKRSKLDNDLTTYLNKYTKITESSVLLEEANKVRDLIDAITDKKSLTEATDAFRLFKSEVSATGYTSKSTADKVKSMLSHITKIGSAFGVASMLINNFTKSLSTLRENDTILTEISKTSEMTKNQLKELGDEAFKIASKYGQLSSNFLLATQEMARAGYDDNVKGMAELSTKAQGAGDMTAELSNQYIIATDKAFKMNGSVEALTATLDGANNITNNNALAMIDLAEAMSIVGSQAASSGMEVDEATAAVATMIAVTQRSGSEMANAFKGILMNLRQVSGDVGDGEDIIDADSLTKYEKACAELGVSLSTVKDGVVSLKEPMQILKELAEEYTKLDEADAKRANLLSAVGGKYRANALNAILENYDMYEKMLKEYADGLGSMDAEAEKTAKSWEGRLAALQNSWDSFINTLTNKEAIMGGISFLDRLIQGAETLTDAIGEIPVVLTTLNTAMTAMNKDYGITQLVNRDSGKLDIQGNLFGIDFSAIKEQKKHFEEAEQAILHWNDKLNQGQTDINKFENILVSNNAQLKEYLSTCSKDAPASLSGYKAYLNAAGVSTDALRIKTILLNSAISFGIGAAIQLAVKGITYLIQREENLRQAAEEAANAYKESSSSIDDYVSKYKELHEALIKAKGNEEETYNIKKQLLDLQTELNDKFGDECGKLNLVTDAYKDQTDVLKAYNQEVAKTYLNENQKGIKKATKEMTAKRQYNLGGALNLDSNDKWMSLREVALQYTDKGISLASDQDGTLYVQLTADAESAYEVINEFESDLREKARELGDEHLFDDILEISSSELNRAKETIDKYDEIYKQALMANMVTDDDKSETYNKALDAVEKYNEAVLKSEDPFNDETVKNAYQNLKEIQNEIDGDDSWKKYGAIVDGVFEQVDTKLIDFNEKMQNDSELQELANSLKDLDNVDLKSLNSGENTSFDKLKESAKEYGLSVDELIDSLVRLGYVQGEIQSSTLTAVIEEQLKTFEDAWTDSFTSEKDAVKELGNTLLELAEQGRLTKETFNEADSTDYFKNLGISADEAVSKINKLVDESSQLSSMASQISAMSDALTTKLEEGFVSADTLAGFDVEVRGLESWDEFQKTLGSTTSSYEECQEAANALATEWVNSSDFLAQLTEQNKEYYATQLEAMGIENYEEVISYALALNEAKEVLAQSSLMLGEATQDEIEALIAEGQYSELTANMILALYDAKIAEQAATLDTSADCANLIALAGDTDVTSKSIQLLIELMNIYSAVESGVYGTNTQNRAMALEKANQIKAELEAIANGETESIEIEPTVKLGSKGKSSASSAGSSAGDAYVDAFEAELEELESLRDSGLIDEAEYLRRLRELYTRYFADRKEYLNEFRKYERQYLEGMKSLYESALSGISKLLGSQIDGYSEAKEAAVSSLTEEKEARLEVINAQKEQLEAEQDLIDGQIKEKQKIIDQIQDEIDAMKDAREERQRQLDLQKAQYELERMMHQRTILQYSEDKGMHYVADESGIRDAKEAVDDAEFEIEIAQKEKEIELIEKQIDLLEEQKDAIQDQIDALDKQSDQIEKYYSKMISEQEKYWDSLINNMEKQKSKWEELAEIEEIAQAYSALEQVFGDMGYTVQDVLNGNEQAFEDFKSKYISLLSDMNSNSSFAEGLSYATGVAEENLGSFLGKTREAGAGIDELASKAGELGTVAEGMGGLADSATTASESTSAIATSMSELGTSTEGLSDNLSTINDALTDIPETNKLDNLTTSFTNLGEAIQAVADVLGIGEDGAVSTLVTALQEISTLSLDGAGGEGGSGSGIISQFNHLKTAVDDVTNAISGGGSSGGQEGDASTSSSPSMSAGAGDEDANGLLGAIDEIKSAASESLGGGEGSEDGAIPQFQELKTAVDDVTAAIGIGESENSEGSENTLIGALRTQYETASEVLPEEKLLFEELLESIMACVSALNSMISLIGSMPEVGGVGGSVSGNITPYAKGTVGNAFANGTGKYKGLANREKNALVSEYGQTEMTVLPNGKTIITDEPTMMDLPKDTVIFNEEQTKKIMDNKVDVSGNAHANGTMGVSEVTGKQVPVPPLTFLDEWDRMEKLAEALGRDVEDLLNPLNSIALDIRKETGAGRLLESINNVNNVTNNKNVQQPVNNTFNITMPNVTNSTCAEELMNDLQSISRKKYQIDW